MDFLDIPNMLPVGALIGLGTLVLTYQKIQRNIKKDRDERDAKILQAAKEEDSLIRAKLEARIEKFGVELKNLEFNVSKDVEHVKETYNTELKNLGEKIELLRDELKNQNLSVLNLLSKLIEK